MFMILFTDSAPRGPAAVDILWKKPELSGYNQDTRYCVSEI
jgi:hypothetical protein